MKDIIIIGTPIAHIILGAFAVSIAFFWILEKAGIYRSGMNYTKSIIGMVIAFVATLVLWWLVLTGVIV